MTPAQVLDGEMQARAYARAQDAVRRIWNGPEPQIRDAATLASLSPVEIGWIVAQAIGMWIVERSAQANEMRLPADALLLQFETKHWANPSPADAALASRAIPALAQLIQQFGIGGKPINDWSRDQIVAFAWTAWSAIRAVELARDESPGPLTAEPVSNLLMAG